MASEASEEAKVEEGGVADRLSPVQLRRELEEEFNVQRAKMKELFLQKEEDIRKMTLEKQQLSSEIVSLRTELQQLQTLSENQKSEIQSLQLLVNETVEASSSGSEELRRLRSRNLELEQLLNQLRQQQQELSLAPATLVRSIARKLGGDSEEHAQKRNTDENEMQSLIQPLEQEIAALKGKLRDTDTQLQEALKTKPTSTTPADSTTLPEGESARSCDMCANYEQQLVGAQHAAANARDAATRAQHALRLATEEVEGVRSLHEETVRAWAAERSAAGEQLESVRAEVAAARQRAEHAAAAADAAARRALHRVTDLTVHRETLHAALQRLEKDNAMLMGQYTKKAEEMQDEFIDLPDSVEDLREQLLQLREQMIFIQVGREAATAAERDLRAQLMEHSAALHRADSQLANADKENKQLREELDRLQTEREQMKELGDKLRHSNVMTEKLLDDKKRLQNEVCELRGRVVSLQQELDNSEKVQQDFVRLSQSLQVQLQRIREADTEVRWQHEDDVNECPECRVPLLNNKKKVHCRHCGRIFCGSCVCHAVPAGPRRVPARVCAVCRTLLQPHAPPYFSTQPPSAPD